MLSVKVKASSVTSLTDARYFAAREVEWLGFQIGQGSDNYMPVASIKAIKEWVDGVKIVGEFGFSTPVEIKEAVQSIGLDAIQVGMFTTPDDLIGLNGTPVIKEVIIDETTSETWLLEHLLDYTSFCDLFLLNFDKSGLTWHQLQRSIPFSVKVLKSVCKGFNVILSMGLPLASVSEILKNVAPFGLNITGGEEEKMGFKSFDDLDKFFDCLEMLD